MNITAYRESWPIRGIFRIAHSERYIAEVIICEIEQDGIYGYGESYPYARYGENCESVIKTIEEAAPKLRKITCPEDIEKILGRGAARAAVDLAYWDFLAKKAQKPIWDLAGLARPKPLDSAYTISIDTVSKVASDALQHQDKKILKIKLSGDDYDGDRIKAIRENARNTMIVVDANESWTPDKYNEIIDICKQCQVAMIEQPFKSDKDDFLATITREIPICADESCHTSADLPNLLGKYDMINIKIDKTGGLTEAIKLKQEARKMGFQIMVGCMVTTSLAIRPAYYLAQDADFVDIDGFALLSHDRDDGLKFNRSVVSE